MASLFALGVMSIVWMAVVAGLIAFEKLIPSRRVATYGTAVVLFALGVLLLVAPDAIPGFTIPGTRVDVSGRSDDALEARVGGRTLALPSQNDAVPL